MGDELLFVTSFTEKMYEATGRSMIESFLSTESEGRMLICTEKVDLIALNSEKFSIYDLDDSEWLKQWLNENSDIIPKSLGGVAEDESFEGVGLTPSQVKIKAYNKDASRWFRKVVCLDYASNFGNLKVIVWVDSDGVSAVACCPLSTDS